MTRLNAAPIRAICFDLDDTLWPTEGAVYASEVALFEWLRQGYPELAAHYTVHTLRDARINFAKSRPELMHDLTKLRTRHLQVLLKHHGYPIERVGDGMAIFLEHRNRVEPYSDVVPALRLLQSHYQLLSLTNGNASVEQTTIGHFFSHSLNSAEVGIAKPDEKIFARLSQVTSFEPQEILHVGDNPHNDIVGAAAAGLRTAWINREAREWEIYPDADFQISNLLELCDVLMSRS